MNGSKHIFFRSHVVWLLTLCACIFLNPIQLFSNNYIQHDTQDFDYSTCTSLSNDSVVYLFQDNISRRGVEYVDSCITEYLEKDVQKLYFGLAKYSYILNLIDSNNVTEGEQKVNSLIKYCHLNELYNLLPEVYIKKAEIYKIQKHYIKAQESLLQGLNYLSEKSEFIKIASLYNDLGLNYLKLNDYSQAEKYILDACEIAESNGELKLLVKYHKNLASVYLYQRRTEEALELLNGILARSSISLVDSSTVLFNVATAHLIGKNIQKAVETYEKCLILRKKQGDINGVARIHNNLSKIYLSNNNYKEAYLHLDECKKAARLTNDQQLLYGNSYNLLDYYITVGEKDSAKVYLKQYTRLRDSIKSIKLRGKLLELDKKYKTLEKDNQIASLQKEDALNQARLKTKNILIIVFGSFLLILFLVAYFVNKQRKELLMSRRRLTRQKEDITGMNEQLRVSNLSKDRILSVIGHDLRGPVGGLKELIELYMELPEYEPQDIDNLLKTAREASTSTYHLLENLLSWANSQRGEIVFNPVATPLLPLIKQTVQLLDNSINTRHVKFAFDIPQSLVVNVDLNMLRTIIRNLVSNALKYSPENGLITISTKEVTSSLHFSVSDQGHGMTAEETQSIFKKKEAYFIGSEMTAKGTGLGLILCKEFVERHGGSIWIDSEKGMGTQVCFSIPVKGIKTKPVTELQGVAVQ